MQLDIEPKPYPYIYIYIETHIYKYGNLVVRMLDTIDILVLIYKIFFFFLG